MLLPLFRTEPRITQDFDVAHGGDCRRVFRDEESEVRVLGLGCVNDDVAVDQGHESLPGRCLSARCSRSQAAGSAMAEAAFK